MPTIAPLDIDTHCLLATFLDDTPCFIGADGVLHRIGNGKKTITIGDGIISTALSTDKNTLLTGGEDGRICRITDDGQVTQLAEIGKKWMTSVACGPDNAFAFASGKTVWTDTGNGLIELAHERSIEGLAFAPKGLRLAVTRYNGVTLHWLGTESKPVELEWKGAHNGVIFSPDGRYVITSMQENALHGWRLADNQHLRMSGYPTKVKSWSWSVKGRHLATSGAMAAIVWPFTSKDGPIGKAPLELGTRANALVTCVSCHPQEEMVAIGYDDGMILFVRFADQKEVLLRRPGKSPITSMDWDTSGHRLVFGSENGECGVIDITA